TDFVMDLEQKAQKANVHTLEGVVEVAKDEPTLLAGKGTLVTENQMVTADQEGIRSARSFDRGRFERMMRRQQPAFVVFAEEVRREEERGQADAREDDQEERPNDAPEKESSKRSKPLFEL